MFKTCTHVIGIKAFIYFISMLYLIGYILSVHLNELINLSTMY